MDLRQSSVVECQTIKNTESVTQISDVDQVRSDTYSILSCLLSHTPNQDLIDYLCHIEHSDDQEIGNVGQAWLELKQAAVSSQLDQLDDEYHDLFIGLGRGQIIPYGSWHLTGFLMDKPLSDLRNDLKKLGIEADPEQKDPEDHIAALFETMSILIQATDVEGYQQRRFYIRHLHTWAEKFFQQLQAAPSARFYKSVGLLGQRFIELENHYLNIQEH